jgi:hypothetical protein
VIRRWLHLQRLKAREFQLQWQLDLWPDEELGPRLDHVRAVRQQAEVGRWLSYPPNGTGSR